MSTLTISSSFTPVRPSGLRLTRRGRLAVLAMCVLAALVVSVLVGGQSSATRDAGTPVPTRTVVVGAGDTLWEIAAEVAEPGEVRTVMHRIEKLNALEGAGLQVGQELAIPLG